MNGRLAAMRLCSSRMRQGGSSIRPPLGKQLGRACYNNSAAIGFSLVSFGTFLPSPFLAANPVVTCTQHYCFSTTTAGDNEPQMVLQKLGDFPYGSREYRLVVQHEGSSSSDPTTVASLRAHRNMLFGAQQQQQQPPGGSSSKPSKQSLTTLCGPLLDAALEDAGVEGDQPQALATLHGLCDWVIQCLDDTNTNSQALEKIKQDDDMLTYHAVRAMATGIPREGHSVVGQGTFRDGEKGWNALAQEFIDLQLAEEVELYRSRGATVVGIEPLADTQPAYLKSAGGAMVRLFFI